MLVSCSLTHGAHVGMLYVCVDVILKITIPLLNQKPALRGSVWVAKSLFGLELEMFSTYSAVMAAGGGRRVARGIIM